MSKSVAYLFLLLCAVGSSSGIEPPKTAGERPIDLFDIGAASFTNFSPRDGLPESVTAAICTDSDGFVWVATPSGVLRYDGRRWVASDDPVMSNSVASLWRDHAGTLWAAFRDKGLAHHDAAGWHAEDRSTGLPSLQIRRFNETQEADGTQMLWALTWDQGLMQHRDGRWQLDPDNAQLPHSPVLSMAQTHRIGGIERVWVGTGSEGLWFRERGAGWRQFRSAGFDPGQVEYLLSTERAGHEELWISVFGAGLWRLTDEGMRSWTKESGDLPTNDLYDTAETPLPNGDRAIWVATRSGLVRIHDDHAVVFDRRHGLPSDVIRSLGAWRSPNGAQVLWLATESGVSRTIIGANQWSTASLMGSHGTGVFAVLIEPDARGGERLWVGSSDEGIGLFEQGKWRTFSRANGALPSAGVRMIAAAADERGKRTLWAGLSYGHLLRVREGPVFEPMEVPWEKRPGEAVLDVLAREEYGRYEQWFGTRQSGIYRRRDNRWTAFRPDNVVGQWRIDKLVEQIDAAGHSWLWATTNQGLARFDGVRWTLLGRDAGLPDVDLIGANLIDDAGHRSILWVGTSNAGIARIDVSNPALPRVLPNDIPAPPDITAYSALRDSAGRIYICTNNGVQQLTPGAAGYTSRVFTREDGMVHDECNTNGQFLDAHDRFWTGTLGGLTVYDPQRGMDDAQPKVLRITDMRIAGRQVRGDELYVEPSARDVRIEFALLSWQRESESRFRTQLVGYDVEPDTWSAQNSRTFNALPPGHYVLRVEARDYAGNLSAPVELPIEMAAMWWQRGWTYVLIAAGALLLGYALVLWRTRALEAQRSELELRIASRTMELQDANARLLELSYKDALTGLANRRSLLERLDQNPRAAESAARTALIFVDVDHFKDYNDHFGHPAGDEALRGVAAVMRRCAPPDALVARYGGEEFACLMPRTSTEQAVAVAERVRMEVAASDVVVPGSTVVNRVTISAGVASAVLANSSDAHSLLRNADLVLYQAKREGRNRVCAIVDEPS
jgi:diguanylate cyclase (GGDEF)-like protein